MDLARENSYPTPYANTSILPILLLSLMQQRHSPITKKTFKSEYDFIIVGAGSAGSVLANRLSEVPCVNILLLEAGKAPPLQTEIPILATAFWNTDINWMYKSTPQKNSARAMINNQVTYISGKTLGGSSIINAMLYTRGNSRNYNDWAKHGAVGWSYSDVLPYFYKLENNTDPAFIADGFHVVGGPLTISEQKYKADITKPVLEAAQQLGYKIKDANSRTQAGFYDAQVTVRNGQRCSTAKAYLVPAENRTNLDIVAEAFVKKVIIKKGKAVGVIVDYNGKIYTVKAKREVIVSAGTVNSAKLLMLSGIGPKKHLNKFKIPVKANLPVGRKIADHYSSALFFELDPRIPSVYQKLINKTNVDNYIKNREGVLSSVGVNPLGFLPSSTSKDMNYPEFELFFGETLASSPGDDGLKPEVIRKYFGPYQNSTLLMCIALILHPKSRGTLRLRSADPYDTPVYDPNYYACPEDIKVVVEGLKTCQKIATSNALKKIGSKPLKIPFPGCEDVAANEDAYFECVARSFLVPIYHSVESAKMGHPNDPTTVVDPRLRVKGIDRLRVVDASIMPVIPSGNTNVPVIMVAEKASDMIKQTLICDPRQQK